MAKTYRLERAQLIQRSMSETFAFFAEAGNLEEITPNFLHFRIVTPQPIEMRPGAIIDYRLRLFGAPIRWRTEIEEFEPKHHFIDRQIQGPYRLWRHRHEFHQTEEGVVVIDQVDYQLPLNVVGRLAHAVFVKATLRKIFDYRQQQIERLLGPAPTLEPSALALPQTDS